MKLLILGATGPTGKELVAQALERDHEVTAVGRKLDAITTQHDKLRLVQGQVTDAAFVDGVVKGHDAVLSALGATSPGATTIYSGPGRHVLDAMKKHGVSRFICTTSGGVEDEDPSFGFVYKRIVKPLFLQKAYDDCKRLEALLRENEWCRWTAVRPSKLTDGPKTGTYRVSPRFSPPAADPQISRADLAHFIVGEVEANAHVHGTPTLAY